MKPQASGWKFPKTCELPPPSVVLGKFVDLSQPAKMIEFRQASKSLDVSASLACWLNLDLGRLGVGVCGGPDAVFQALLVDLKRATTKPLLLSIILVG